jgi:hypothetical protein
MATCCQIDRIFEARLDQRIINAIMHNLWWSSLLVKKNQRSMEWQHCRYQKINHDFQKKEMSILMELSIHRNTHDSVSDNDTTPQFQSEINRKNSSIQIDVVHNFSRFSSIRKHFGINMVVTNNMSTYESNLVTIDSLSEKKKSHQRNCIGQDTVSNQRKIPQLPRKISQ